MKYLEPHGLVVVPVGEDGKPRGVAFWCEGSKEAARVVLEEGGPGRTYSLIAYREVPAKKD